MSSNNNDLTWRHLKALNDLYSSGSTKAKIDEHPYIKFLISKRYLIYKVGNHSILEAKQSFKELYESKFKESFKYFDDFLILQDYQMMVEVVIMRKILKPSFL